MRSLYPNHEHRSERDRDVFQANADSDHGPRERR